MSSKEIRGLDIHMYLEQHEDWVHYFGFGFTHSDDPEKHIVNTMNPVESSLRQIASREGRDLWYVRRDVRHARL